MLLKKELYLKKIPSNLQSHHGTDLQRVCGIPSKMNIICFGLCIQVLKQTQTLVNVTFLSVNKP